MAQAVRQRFTVDEYLIVEEQGEIEHEFLDGQVWAMAGGSPEHAAIAANLAALFTTALRGQRCRVFSADLRVRILATGLATYPDLTIVCERLEPDPADRSGHTVTNPRVVVEVLSPSTEDYDRTEKLGHYRQVPSLAEIVLVAHDRRAVEVVRRGADGAWTREQVTGDGVARLTSLGCGLPLTEVHRDPLA